MSTLELLQVVLEKRGYLVVGHSEPHPIGHVIPYSSMGMNGIIDHPLYIIAETDVEDFWEQIRLFVAAGDDYADRGFIPPHYKYWYRCQTD
jgi:hypothetical protein